MKGKDGKSKSMKKKHAFHHMKAKEHHGEHKKAGGKAHHAHGGHSKHRLDKKARGGKIASPHSPLSGADPKTMRVGAKMKAGEDKEND